MAFRSAVLAFACVALVPSCIILDVRDLPEGGASSYESVEDDTCPSRNGGETDHVLGDRWFNGGELCRCVDVDGEPTTECTRLCDARDVRFMDSDGLVCSCDVQNAIACEGDGNDAECECLCNDPDDDGICDD